MEFNINELIDQMMVNEKIKNNKKNKQLPKHRNNYIKKSKTVNYRRYNYQVRPMIR